MLGNCTTAACAMQRHAVHSSAASLVACCQQPPSRLFSRPYVPFLAAGYEDAMLRSFAQQADPSTWRLKPWLYTQSISLGFPSQDFPMESFSAGMGAAFHGAGVWQGRGTKSPHQSPRPSVMLTWHALQSTLPLPRSRQPCRGAGHGA